MNVLIVEKAREHHVLPLGAVKYLDFVFIDHGNGFFEVYKNRLNAVRGTITLEQVRELIHENEKART